MKSIKYIFLLASFTLIFSSCKDDFLEEKRDLSGVNEEVFKDPLLAKAYIDYVYYMFQPPKGASSYITEQNAPDGKYTDDFTQTTEELAGQTDFNREWAQISNNQNHALKYFGERLQSGIRNNVWTRMKQINIFLDNVDKYNLPDGLKAELKGQLYFWRAWQYFELLRLYGGVPLVLTAQDPITEDGDKSNEVPRSKSSETLEQIVKDLDAAISVLPPKWSGDDWGRITSGAAAALKGRVLLTWASPLFNRNDDVARWQRAYDANLAAKTLLESGGFGLYKVGSLANGQALEKMFLAEGNNPEAVFGFGFNTKTADQEKKNSGWEQAARPRGISGSGSISPTKEMMDAFPMKDGKMPGSSTYSYSLNKFYKNRDPRFYKTFAYNGSLWPYNENKNYRVWTYSWFSNATALGKNIPDKTTESNSTGVFIRKATNPAASNSNEDFQYSGTDFMEIRFAEVLLNLAESAIGINKLSDGLTLIKSIRERAGVENLDGAYGLSDVSSRNQHFAAVLNERKVEFAYEGKRFWDLRRWLLFNDDFGQLTRLGMQPLDGTRRTGLWIKVKKADGSYYVGSADPMLRSGSSPAPVIEREPATLPAGMTNFDDYLDYLYDTHFEVVVKDNLESNASWKFKWYNEYYFFGLHKDVLTVSPYLQQTKDWPDLTGQMGTFDPLQ